MVWHHEDGEVSMAQPLGAHSAALAFAGMWQVDDARIRSRRDALQLLAGLLLHKS